MLVELSVVEQRYQAVLAVIRDGVPVTEVADRFGVSRQAVHRWLRWYEDQGLPGLVDRSHRPPRCSHQMDPANEVWILEARRRHPDWGPRRLVHEAVRAGLDPVPSRSGVYRALKRSGMIDPQARRRRDRRFKRWERGGAMELWQMDVVGGVLLADGAQCKILTGIDDHSRFVVCAGVMARATSRAVCAHFAAAMRAHGVPQEILTLNGTEFGSQFHYHVLDAGVGHVYIKPATPRLNGKVERSHRIDAEEFYRMLDGVVIDDTELFNDRLKEWEDFYNYNRPHGGLGGQTPYERLREKTTSLV